MPTMIEFKRLISKTNPKYLPIKLNTYRVIIPATAFTIKLNIIFIESPKTLPRPKIKIIPIISPIIGNIIYLLFYIIITQTVYYIFFGYISDGDKMKVYIDADGNAVTGIVEEICKKHNIPVIAVKNYNINLKSDYMEVVTVDDYKESADLYIANHISKDDILITNDYGLSSLVVNKCKKIINQSGMIIDNSNIDFLLNTRHIHKEMRLKHNVYTKSKKRTSLNDETFKSVFENYILSEIRNSPL